MACLKSVKAAIARALFAIHAFITVWRVVDTKGGNPAYWFLAAAILLLIFEGIVSICSRQGEEMKWFCPSVFFYLLSIVPPIWILELDMNQERHLLRRNATLDLAHLQRVESLSTLLDLNINISLPREMWTKILEQILLVMLVIGRWLLPKGDLTREQLSQLLLVYTGMAADIVELFEAFKEDAVLENLELTYAVLGIWSWSLLQFTLVLTSTHGRKPRLGMDSTPTVQYQESSESIDSHLEENSIDMGIIAIVTSVVLQDGPFLLLRLVLIFRYNAVSYLNIFFTCKNSLVACLQLYRLSVLCVQRRPFKICNQSPADDESTEDPSTDPPGSDSETIDEETENPAEEEAPKQKTKDRQEEDPDQDLWEEFKQWRLHKRSMDLNDLFLRTAILAKERRLMDFPKFDPASKMNPSDSETSDFNSHEFYPCEEVSVRPGSSVSQQKFSTPTVKRRIHNLKHPSVKKTQDCESFVSAGSGPAVTNRDFRKNPEGFTKIKSCPPSSYDSGNSSTSVPDLRKILARNQVQRNYYYPDGQRDPSVSRKSSKRVLNSEDEDEKLRNESYV